VAAVATEAATEREAADVVVVATEAAREAVVVMAET